MDVDRDEGKEDVSFVPSAVSDSDEWHELRFMSYRQCRKEGIAAIVMEDDGKPHKINFCKYCYNMRQGE